MAWWKTAKVGDKVACCWKYGWHTEDGVFEDGPVFRQIYTVTRVAPVDWTACGVSVEFSEFPGNLYNPAAFRRLKPKRKSSETGVAALKRHLIGAPVTEGVE